MIKGGLRWVQALELQVTSAIPSDFEFPPPASLFAVYP